MTEATPTPIADARKVQEIREEYAVPIEDAFPHGTPTTGDAEVEEFRLMALADARRDYEDRDNALESLFGPGTTGAREALDRVAVQVEVWHDHVATHPAVVLDPGLYLLARRVEAMMDGLYGACGGHDVRRGGPR